MNFWKEWGLAILLVSAVVASLGYMTLTLNNRIDDVDRHLSGRMDRIEARMGTLEEKIDNLDEKVDQILIALAGRGFLVPGKQSKAH